MNLIFNIFEASDEEKMDRQQKEKYKMVKCGETLFEGKRVVNILWDSLCLTVLLKLLNTCG